MAQVSLPYDLPEAKAVDGEKLDTPPRLVKRGKPIQYPEHLFYNDNYVRGVVRARIRVERDGSVSAIEVLFASHPAFVAPAIGGIYDATFRPATALGQPVAAWAEFDSSFDVKSARGRSLGGDARRVPVKIPGLPPEFDYDEPPVLLSFCEPVYPRQLLLTGTKGDAAVRIVIDEHGRVIAGEVMQTTHPAFGASLLAAMETWVFRPARKGEATSKAVIDHQHRFIPASFRRPPAENEAVEVMKRKASFATEERLDRPLRALWQPKIEHPAGNWARPGEAEVEFVVHKSGQVVLAETVAATDPALGAIAENAVQQWVFAPPTAQGKPVLVRVRRTLQF